MSTTPTTWDVTVFPLGQPGAIEADSWQQIGFPATIQFVNGQGIKSLWFPNPQGPMSFYAGSSATGSPFYTTTGVVPELVPIPNDAPVVTVTGPTVQTWIYASTNPFPPSLSGAAPTINFGVQAPIVNLGVPSAPIVGLTTPLAVSYGGSGSSNPSLVAGANITIGGVWPNQTIAASTGAGGVQSVTVNAPLLQSGPAQNPVLSLTVPLPILDGGTATANPWLQTDSSGSILLNAASGVHDQSFQWALSLGAFLQDNSATPVTGGPVKFVQQGGITVTVDPAHTQHIIFNTAALIPVTGGLTSTDGTITITPNAGAQTVNLSGATVFPVYLVSGAQQLTDHITRSQAAAYTVTYTGNSLGSTTVTFVGAAAFTSGTSYSITYDVQNVSGATPPIFVLQSTSRTGGGFTVTGYGNGGTGSGNITFDIICVGH